MASVSDHERVKLFQSLALSLAVVAGGAWTLIEFTRLHHVEVADAEVAELRKALADVQLSAGYVVTPDSQCMITITAKVHNQGRRKLYLDLKSPSLTLAYMDITREGAVGHSQPWSLYAWTFDGDRKNVIDLPSSELVPNEVAHYLYLTTIAPMSIVLAEFKAPVIEVLAEDGRRRERESWYWSGRSFITTCGMPAFSSSIAAAQTP